jgi:S-adenosylmethionine-dependent methyltransferase
MLEQARLRFAQQKLTASFLHCDWQQLASRPQQPYDLILCHAVLEWLADPAALIAALNPMLKADGWLSLAFYNKDALVMHNLIKGNLRKLAKQSFTGEQGGLTPQQPLDPRAIEQLLHDHGWLVRQRSGIRVFHDYMRPEFRQKIADDELVATELEYRRHPALGPLGRYLHWLCQPAGS